MDYRPIVKIALKRVKKGEVRNTVLGEKNGLEKTVKLLNQGKEIKSKEIGEYKGKSSDKIDILQKQVDTIEKGVYHIEKAIKILKKYENLTTTPD